MATDSSGFDEILQQFDALSSDQQEDLLDRLVRHQATAANGQAAGQSALDGFKQRGLLGSIQDAPSDWSTNPEYLEGFGQNDQ
jgi:hypothetical protein